MRQQRRQDLRTNELSEQLEQMTDYARRNAAMLVAVVIAASVIVGGGWWYLHHRKTRLMEGWATLSLAADRTEPGSSPIATFESVAQADINPGLTAEALLMVGNAAMEKFQKLDEPNAAENTGETPVPQGSQTDWAAKAERAYAEILTRFPDNITAVGPAMILTGVLCEDRQDYAKAREWYQKVFDDQRFAHTPFRQQAGYRLEHLDHWKIPIIFPEPLHTVPEPPPAAATTAAEAPPQPVATPPASAQPMVLPITPLPTPTPPSTVPPPPAPPAPAPGGSAPDAAPAGGTPAQPAGAAPPPSAGAAPAQPAGTTPPKPAGDTPAQPTSAPAGG